MPKEACCQEDRGINADTGSLKNGKVESLCEQADLNCVSGEPCTRNIQLPRDDSAEADLFRYVIRELSTGGVIRQARSTTEDGRFLKKRPTKNLRQKNAQTMESAFEGTKQYVLTGLGKQFVHYTMNELVQRIEA